MANNLVDSFINALQTAEQSGNVDQLVALFGEDAVLGNVVTQEAFRGGEGAQRFWQEYLRNFRSIRSKFRNVIQQDNRAALEWYSEAEVKGNRASYSGVSVLEHNGERITRFHAYFDTRQVARAIESGAEQTTRAA